jgi:hypothetical protein
VKSTVTSPNRGRRFDSSQEAKASAAQWQSTGCPKGQYSLDRSPALFFSLPCAAWRRRPAVVKISVTSGDAPNLQGRAGSTPAGGNADGSDEQYSIGCSPPSCFLQSRFELAGIDHCMSWPAKAGHPGDRRTLSARGRSPAGWPCRAGHDMSRVTSLAALASTPTGGPHGQVEQIAPRVHP